VLTSRSEIVETRVSNSKPHLGIIRSRTEITNQRGEAVFSHEGAALIERRDHSPADQSS
jgi:acyl dehydratase